MAGSARGNWGTGGVYLFPHCCRTFRFKCHLSPSRDRSPRGNRANGIPPPVIGINRSEVRVVTTSRRAEVVRLRETGLTYAEIGRRFGLSKERIRQIVKRISSPKKPTPEIDVMLRVGQVAQLLGMHPNTVRRWNNKGILKAYRISPRGDRRFRRRDIDGFLKEAEIE